MSVIVARLTVLKTAVACVRPRACVHGGALTSALVQHLAGPNPQLPPESAFGRRLWLSSWLSN